MKLGAVFPNNTIGADPLAARDFAQAVEEMGFHHLTIYDHVFGASAARYDRVALPGPYRENDVFNEPFVLFGYLAALTSKIQLTTGVLILAQRQTVLVAKQAAQVDLLSGGRLRLGVGTGWNYTEYEALGEDWSVRGARVDEQVGLLRKLWTQELVDFKGRFHSIPGGGINPLPVQRPIPIFLGGSSDPVLRRVVSSADGWMPVFRSMEARSQSSQKPFDPRGAFDKLRGFAEAAGRDPATIEIDCRLSFDEKTPDEWRKEMELYRSLGASYITLLTLQDPTRTTIDAHVKALRQMKDALS